MAACTALDPWERDSGLMYQSGRGGSMPQREEQLAHAVLAQNLRVRKGESVTIESWTHSLPYARAFVREARRLGARPTVLYEDEDAWWEAVGAKRYSGFGTLSDAERAAVRASDVYIYFWGPEDRPKVDRLSDKDQGKVIGYNEEWYRVARKAGLRGCRMTVAQATDPVAETFGFDGANWRSRLLEAGSVDSRLMKSKGDRIAERVRSGRELRIHHSNGTDLTLKLSGVHARVDVGVVGPEDLKRPYGMLTNNPSGQVFIAIDKARAEGTFVSNRAVYLGPNRFDGARWTFVDGRLDEHSGGAGTEIFEKQYKAAPKGREVLGYLSIGLNPKAEGLAPCEDTEEGAVLIGIGRNTQAGGKIRIPFQGYALLGEGTLEIDGRAIAEGGTVH